MLYLYYRQLVVEGVGGGWWVVVLAEKKLYQIRRVD